MFQPLDILAIEPYYGGPRKAMLDTLIKCSGHRWTLLKLPPRRIERRLVAAAHWFAEQLTLHWVSKVDMIFASEALNLADLYRLIPSFAGKPSVVYFHENQLPIPGTLEDITAPAAPAILANLSTAAAAHELWFNSLYHQNLFLERARALLERDTQNFSRNPLTEIAHKCRVMHPPTDLGMTQHVKTASSVQRDVKTMFVDTNGSDIQALNEALAILQQRREKFSLITTGPDYGISTQWPRESVAETDDYAIAAAMLKSGIFLSTRPEPTFDLRLVQALAAGCWPIVPLTGSYPELIPKMLNERCIYDCTAGGLAYTAQDFWELELPLGHAETIRGALKPFHSVIATKAMDERLMELAIVGTTGG